MCLRVCITGEDFGTILIEPSVSRTASLTSFTDSTPCSRIAISSSDRSTPSLRRCGTTNSPSSMRTVGVPSRSRPQNSPRSRSAARPRLTTRRTNAARTPPTTETSGPTMAILDGVRDEEDHHEVEYRHLPEFALAHEPQADVDGQIHDHRPDNDLPTWNLKGKHRQDRRTGKQDKRHRESVAE